MKKSLTTPEQDSPKFLSLKEKLFGIVHDYEKNRRDESVGQFGMEEARVFLIQIQHSWPMLNFPELWPQKLHLQIAELFVKHSVNRASDFFDVIDRFSVPKRSYRRLVIVSMKKHRSGGVLIDNKGKLRPFSWYDQEIALLLIKYGCVDKVMEQLDLFHDLDRKEIMLAVVKYYNCNEYDDHRILLHYEKLGFTKPKERKERMSGGAKGRLDDFIGPGYVAYNGHTFDMDGLPASD